MDICDRFGLRTEDHQTFCRGMMRAVLDGLPETARVSDFLARLKVLEKELTGLLSFSLSSELTPLEDFFTPEAALSDLRRCWEEVGDAARVARMFADEKRFEALDAVLVDESSPEKDRTARLSVLMTAFVGRQRRFYGLRHASLEHAGEIRRLCARLPFYRDRVLGEFDLGRRTRAAAGKTVAPTRKTAAKKTTTRRRSARNETVLRVRPWVPVFEAVEVARGDGPFGPFSEDFIDACVAGPNRQEGEVLRVGDTGYRIRYLVDGRWTNQDEAVFAREEAWLRGAHAIPLSFLDRLPPTAEYRASLIDAVRDALGAVLTPAFRMAIVTSLVLASLPDGLSARGFAGWAYEIVGRLDAREPWARHHTSLREKLRGCFLRFDRLAGAGHGILFPEAVSPDAVEWDRLRERFFFKTMKTTIGDDIRVEALPVLRGAPPVLEEAGALQVRDETGTLIDVSQLEEEDIPGAFEADHVVFGGVGAFGIFCEAPGYYRLDGGGPAPTERSKTAPERELGLADLEELLDELEKDGIDDGEASESEDDQPEEEDDDDEENPTIGDD